MIYFGNLMAKYTGKYELVIKYKTQKSWIVDSMPIVLTFDTLELAAARFQQRYEEFIQIKNVVMHEDNEHYHRGVCKRQKQADNVLEVEYIRKQGGESAVKRLPVVQKAAE